MADKVLKGAKNIEFKYGGSAVDLYESFYKLELLSADPVNLKGTEIVPMDLVLTLSPPAPKYLDEIKAIIEEGMILEQAFSGPGLFSPGQLEADARASFFSEAAKLGLTVEEIIERPVVYCSSSPPAAEWMGTNYYAIYSALLIIMVRRIRP